MGFHLPAEPLAKRLGIELRIVQEIGPDELEPLLGEAVLDEFLQLAQRLADDEVPVRVRERPDPDREILLLAAVVRGRELVAALDEMLDVGVVAVVLAALFADLLKGARGCCRCSPKWDPATQRAKKSLSARVSAIGKPIEIAVAGVVFSAIDEFESLGRLRRRKGSAAA